MAELSEARLRALLEPYLQGPLGPVELTGEVLEQLGTYQELLGRWNARTNLTAVRDPEEMVRRHFGESLFAGLCLRPHLQAGAEVLDLGSGAGFPGIPIQLLQPEVRVTLAESQGKKVAFLREVVRGLGLRCEVWAGRVEAMEASRRFDAVTLRAVDRMQVMAEVGWSRLRIGGVLLQMTTDRGEGGEVFAIPERLGSVVWIRAKVDDVPRGTLD